MAVEEKRCNGFVKVEDSSGEGFITYKRRKRGRSSSDACQDMKQAHDMGLCSSTYEQDDHARIHSHWRQVLEHLLQLPDVSEGSGIQGCIQDALICGPSGFSRMFKMTDSTRDTSQAKDRYEGLNQIKSWPQKLDGTASDVSKTGASDVNAKTIKCQNVFLDILRSEKFALLCDLLCVTLQDNKGKRFFDFSLINSKMKNSEYEKLPGLFDQDIQQVWDKFQKIGREMVLLASSLSNISRASFLEQVGQDLVNGAGEYKPEESYRVGVEQMNSVESYTTMQLASCESDHSTKPDQTEASGLYKVCTCKKCGTEANGKRSLICDGCEAMYHFSCIEPAIKEIPTRSWYCSSCRTNKRESSEPTSAHIHPDSSHQNCAVCDRLEFLETKEENVSASRTMMVNGSRERSSVSSMESEESPELSRTAMSRLCKLCGTCEDEDKRFLICGHVHCPYKFYHIRCLKSSQIATAQQQNRPCWYCPSCLCRVCLCDKDDDKIVLCDGCDEAYHIYCMKPPRTSIPKGQWYCIPCNVARAREGMRRYEQWMLQRHRKNDVTQANEANRSMDLLLSAAEKLSSEEELVAGKKDK